MSPLYPSAPPGTTPERARASRPTARRSLVANADNNTVAVVDIEQPGRSEVEGFIPTGWYPTAVLFDRDGQRLFVLSGKGLIGAGQPARPAAGQPGRRRPVHGQHAAGRAVGDRPSRTRRRSRRYTDARRTSCRAYTDATKLTPARRAGGLADPAPVGDPSPIKHVIYIIKENRTYDQVLGDMRAGQRRPDAVASSARR